MKQNFIIKEIGKDPKRLGVLVCTHGDETLGHHVMKIIENKVNNLTFILMNKRAFDKKKRYIDFDLNRCFLGNSLGKGITSYEYELSQELHGVLLGFKNIIDIHSTSFDIEPYFIIDTLKKKESEILKSVSNDLIKNAYLIPISKGTVIGSYPNAVAIECGANDNGNKIIQIAKIVESISNNIGFNYNHEKIVSTFGGELTKKDVFKLRENIKDFQLIIKGSILGYDEQGAVIKTKEDIRLFWVNNKFDDENIVAIKLSQANIS